ncbi:hypothetical protein RJ639_002467 [Escallonia herrerae]|uniref:Ketoreductase domain-containing protein n=1 Tax=Escallonia herrerae TaxID=1293975 RepID=A0AA88XBE5_9ASTE|nr:hypothetical protein RJ639_002467 [Escallonia herrerae]
MDLINGFLNLVAPPFTFFTLLLFLPPFQLFKLLLSTLRSVFSEDLTGKVVLITGASSGIGEHLAYEYARRGACLALAARRENRLREVADNAREIGAPDVIAVRADVANVDDCKRFVEQSVNHFGRLDHLVNNAGITSVSMFDDTDDVTIFKAIMETFEFALACSSQDVNFWGTVYTTRFAAPHLRSSGGKIIVLSSSASWLPMPRMSFYNASKAAIAQFFETLRVEMPEVHITLVTPGFIESELTQGKYLNRGGKLILDQEMRDVQVGLIPVQRVEECAKAIVSRAARGERYVTEPKWFRVTYFWKLFCPELVEWTYRLLFLTKMISSGILHGVIDLCFINLESPFKMIWKLGSKRCIRDSTLLFFTTSAKVLYPNENVAGKVVLIAGASSGIARRRESLREVAERALRLGSPDAIAVRADISRVGDCKRLIDEAMNHFGRLNHLVNVAGETPASLFEETPDVTKLAPAMASKAAVISFYETLRVELGSDIGITIVTPGLIESEMTKGKFLDKEGRLVVNQVIRDVIIGPTPIETVGKGAEAIVNSARRGDKYLTEPSWYRATMYLKAFFSEIVVWLNRLLFLSPPGAAAREALSKQILDLTGLKNNLVLATICVLQARALYSEHLAYEYARRGACLALVARREDRLQTVASKSRQIGSPEVIVIPADISRVDDCKGIVDSVVTRFGRLDHLVNNAGIAPLYMFEDHICVADHASVMATKAALISFYETLRSEFGFGYWHNYCNSRIGRLGNHPRRFPSEGILCNKANRKFVPLVTTERCATAIVYSIIRGESYLTEPAWTRVLLLWKGFCPEVLDWCNRFLLVTSPKTSQSDATNKKRL